MNHAARCSILLIMLAVITLSAGVFAGGAFGKAVSPPAGAQDDRTLSPYFFVKGGDAAVDELPLKATSARVSISGTIADVQVTQTYKNQGKKALEAVYVFPASTRAAVYAMRMTIGKRVIEARIAKREEARQAYAEARSQGKSASLLEQQRPNVFQMNVANIIPGDEVRVELKYTELLVPAHGVYEFVYPTVVGPRYSNRPADARPAAQAWVHNPFLHAGAAPTYAFDISATVAAGLPVRELACPSHKVNVQYEGPTVARIDLDKSEKEGGNRDYILRYRLDGDRIESGLLLYEGDKENFFLLTTEPPRKVKKTDVLSREYIFIVDVSGSMWGYPLDISKKLVKDLLAGLRPSDLFNVILFSGGSSVMAEQSVPATAENIRKAAALIDGRQGGGGTELLPALKQALGFKKQDGYSRSIVIATDGYVDVEEEVFDLIRNNLGSANIFAFGIGTSVNRYLIEGVARVGMGEPFIVTRPEEAPAKAERFREIIQSPVLTGVKVTAQGFDVYDMEPPHIPDVLSERPVIVFGKYHGTPRGKIVVTGVSGEGSYRETIDAASARPLPGNGALRYLWARHRIALLSDYNNLRADESRTRAVTDLGLRYNLLTAYTSFVAVDTEIRVTGGAPVTVKQPLPLPQGVSDYAVGGSGGGMFPALAMAPSPSMMGGGYGAREMARMPKSMPKALKYDARAGGGGLGGMPDVSGSSTPAQAARVGSGASAPAKRAAISVGEITAAGPLSKEAIAKVVRAETHTLEKYYQGNGSAAQFVARLKIGADGTVKEVKIVTGAADWKRGIVDRIRRWRFPKGGEGAQTLATITLYVGV